MRHICPICKKVIKNTTKKWRKSGYFPFCSGRCKLIDIGAWFDGKYRINGGAEQGDFSVNTKQSEKNQAETADSDN
jgi:endogenous inhibitor of DNA gyrase (YacG/DUF329 family)